MYDGKRAIIFVFITAARLTVKKKSWKNEKCQPFFVFIDDYRTRPRPRDGKTLSSPSCHSVR
jgi:hypothetical protein